MYTLTVTAFKESTAIAEGRKTAVTISESQETEVSIILGPKTNAGNGTFAYDLTIPSGIADPTLYVTTLTGEAVSGGTIFLSAGQQNTGTLTLASGVYKARLVLTQSSTVAGFNSEAVHIYSGLTSLLSREFMAFVPQKVSAFDLTGLFPAPVIGVDPILTFTADQYSGFIQWKAGGIEHSGPFAGNTVYTAEITLEADIAYTFEEIGVNVFSHSGISGTNSANSGVLTLVFGPTAAVGGLLIDIGFNHGDIAVSGSNRVNTIYRDGMPNSLTLSVSGYTDMSWYVDAGMTELTGNPLTLEAGDYGIGSHIVNFNGYKSGVPFSQMVPFTVANEDQPVTVKRPKFVAVGIDESGNGKIAVSEDGGDWTVLQESRPNQISEITYGNGRFVTVGVFDGQASWSVDGVNWNMVDLPGYWTAVTYRNGRFVAVAPNSSVIGRNDQVAWSEDGKNWTREDLPYCFWSITYGNDRFIAAGKSGVAWSVDGINWTILSAFPASNYGRNVTYENGRFFVMGWDSSTTAWSVDGINWTASINFPIHWLAYGNGRFVVVEDKKATWSEDGINWTAATNTPQFSTGLGITYGNGRFVAVGYKEPYSAAVWSEDGDTWAPIPTLSGL
jgi:hypothetical protein